jgi:hypothetical protein
MVIWISFDGEITGDRPLFQSRLAFGNPQLLKVTAYPQHDGLLFGGMSLPNFDSLRTELLEQRSHFGESV